MTDKEILAKIEDYMKNNNLRQYELARKLGVPESTLNRWLREKTDISKAYLVILREKGII